jgi:hypothetical protein
MNEIPYDAYSDLVCIFGADTLSQLREEFKDNCVGLAQTVKMIMNTNGFLAEIITFKNGNAFLDGGITINLDHTYTHHAVVLMGDWVIDVLHTDKIIKTKDYIIELQKHNPKLRIDYTLSTGWYTDNGYPYKPNINDLINYRY